MNDPGENLREELNALVDGALPEERAEELRRRIKTDANLRQEYDELAAVVRLVRGLGIERAPDTLRARVREALGHRSRVLRPRWRWAVAAAALLAAGLLIVPRLLPGPGAAPQSVERVAAKRPAGVTRARAMEPPRDHLMALERKKAGAPEKRNLVASIEKGGSLSREDYGSYLAALLRLSGPELAHHIAAVAERRGRPLPSTAAPLRAELTLPDSAAAVKLRALLLRSYEALDAGKDRAAPRVAFAGAAREAQLVRPQEAPEALMVDLDLTLSEEAALSGWLRLFETAALRARSRVVLRGGKKKEGRRKEEAQRRRAHIVIHVGPPAGKPPKDR